MKPNAVTYVGFVQDHSGSMMSNADLAMSNFNEQRAKLLKEEDETMEHLVTIIEFDDQIHCNVDNMPINEVKEMGHWWCGGMTALYDGIANCINNIRLKMDADKREDKAALVVIQTDGHENQSSDYAGEEGRVKINKLINELEATKRWTFVFLGENIDKELATQMGFKMNNIMSHNKSEVQYAYSVTTQGLDSYLKSRKDGETQVMNWYNQEGNSAKGE